MDEIYVTVERHDQMIKTLERDVAALREVQGEIRSMNQTLLTLANELKHTNEHLARHERKIEEIDSQPKYRMQQIVTAIIAALTVAAAAIVLLVSVGVLFHSVQISFILPSPNSSKFFFISETIAV